MAIYQDRLLDKLILKNNMFISGNENYLVTGNFKVIPASMSCQAVE